LPVDPALFDQISRRTPCISAIYPNHPTYTMEEFDPAGGLGAVMKELAANGLVDADTQGMFGRLGSYLVSCPDVDGDVIRSCSNPIHSQGGLAVLSGNLATESCIVKFSAVDPHAWTFSGKARVFNSQDDAWQSILDDEIDEGDVVVIRYEGPRGSPGMPHMETFMAAVLIALVSDGRFSGATGGLAVGHVSPEAYDGGVIALIEDGDVITIDIPSRILRLEVPARELERRKANWQRIEKPASGWLKLYRVNTSSAHRGATVYWENPGGPR